MPPEGRLLTIHCAGPDRIEASTRATDTRVLGGIELHFATLSSQRARVQDHFAVLDPSERERAARFRFDVDRERYITAHGLLRALLGERLGTSPEGLRFERGPYGKPFIAGSDLHFNLSDTKDALVIAIGRMGEIGVDIETMNRSVDHLAVSEQYFTPEEVMSIRGAGSSTDLPPGLAASPSRPPGTGLSLDRFQEDPSKRRFLELWTRKEAVLKASGVGIMNDLRVLRVVAPVNTMSITHEAFVKHAAERYHLHTWHLGPEHILSVAQAAPVKQVRLFRS